MKSYFPLIILCLSLIVAGRNQAHKITLLKCTPSIVKLVGTITNVIFPGPPNYKSVAKGDEPEHYWILKLGSHIDVAEDRVECPVPEASRPQMNVSNLQLNLDVYLNADYAAYQKFMGKRVEVTGELTQAYTVHHKTPVMIWVRDIQLAK